MEKPRRNHPPLHDSQHAAQVLMHNLRKSPHVLMDRKQWQEGCASNTESVPRETSLFIVIRLCTFLFICQILHQAILFLLSYSIVACCP